jgi:2-keto-4-pentenoate hydratase
MREIVSLIPVCVGLCAALPALACTDPTTLQSHLDRFEAKAPSQGFGANLTIESARCVQQMLSAELQKRYGPIVGYKVGFTNAEMQRRFNVSGPLWGTMFKGWMLPNNSRMPANFGARPAFEADLVAIVRSPDIHQARTPLEALSHLEAFAAFIELVDPAVSSEIKLDAPTIVSVNVAHRGGVLGNRIPIRADQSLVDALGNMAVVATDQTGKELARLPGSFTLGNPINAVLYLAQELPNHGIRLKAGDLLALGSYPGPLPISAGSTVTVRYEGLPGDPVVRVRFE